MALLLTIALGIGSMAAVHGFVRGLVTRDLPLPGIDTIVSLFERDARDTAGPMSYEEYLWFKEGHLDAFESLGAARESQGTVVLDGRTSVMSMAELTPEIADVLQLALGKGAVISHRVWQMEFGAKADVRGELIRIDGVDTRVAGVAPDWLDSLYLGRDVDVWMALPERSLQGVDRNSRTFWVLGRLRPGVSVERAQGAVNAARGAAGTIAVLPYTGLTPEMSVGLSRIGSLLRAAAGAVFFIACANVASFLLARASARSKETSVRVALGANRAQLATQLLSDSVLISVTGGAGGILLAMWTRSLFPALFFEQDAEQLVFAPNLVGVAVASAACAGVVIACGLVPLFETRDDNPAAVLQRESAGPSTAMRRLRAGLVVAQMTCCCVLVISTSLLLQGFRTALQTNVGHRLGRPILATVEARPASTHAEMTALGLEYFDGVERAAQTVPGISASAWVGRVPGSRPAWQSIRVEPPHLPLRDVVMDVAAFTPHSLAVVTLPPIAGRLFGGRDTPQTCKVVVVNTAAADELFDGDASGRSIEDPAGRRVEIIGVVAMRKAETTTAHDRPTIFYYADQMNPPLDRTGPMRFGVPMWPQPERGVLDANVVSPSYFEAMGVQATAGNVFSTPPTGCRVGVINQEAAELYFGGNAVGGAVIDRDGRRTEVIGVVDTAPLRLLQRRAEPAIYLPMSQDFVPRMTLFLGTQEAHDAMTTLVRRRLESVPGGAGDVLVTTLDAHLSRSALAPERIATVLVGVAAATAFALGVLGAYSVMAESVRQRQHEIALRIALGAQSWRVLRQVLGDAVQLASIGTVAGVAGSLLIARWLTRIIPSGDSPNIWVWLSGPLVLVGAVLIASLLPARRAWTVDPLTSMRDS